MAPNVFGLIYMKKNAKFKEEAIDYETKALHFSVHMFFKKTEIKRELHALVRNFAYKNWMESKKTAKSPHRAF